MNSADPISHLHSNFNYILCAAGRNSAPDKLEQCEQYTRCLTGLAHPLGNLVLAREQTEEQFRSLLAETEEWVAVNGAPVAMALFPDMGLADRATWIDERDWVLMDKMPGMWMDIPEDFSVGELAPGASVRLANDPEGLDQVCRVLTEGYPLDPEVTDFFMRGIHEAGEANQGDLANFLVTLDGQPAACSSVCIRDGVAGVYCVATVESCRRKGLGGAVTRAAVEYAHRRGIRHALLHATEMGMPVYSKIGFRELCRIPVYGCGLG